MVTVIGVSCHMVKSNKFSGEKEAKESVDFHAHLQM